MNRDRMLWIVLAVIGVGCAALMFNNDAGATLGMANDQFASLIYLGAFALVIGAALFSRGLPAGHILRTGALWLCVILALTVVYQVLAAYGMLPENFAPRFVPESGTGVTASLVDGVDRHLHL